jgi:hypothetical protein
MILCLLLTLKILKAVDLWLMLLFCFGLITVFNECMLG